jgi:hypothetical protein
MIYRDDRVSSQSIVICSRYEPTGPVSAWRWPIHRGFILFCAMTMLAAAPAVAAVVWPTNNSDWTKITQNSGDSYTDSKDTGKNEDDRSDDIRGDNKTDKNSKQTRPAGYYYLDDSQYLLMFRIRVNADPEDSGTWDKFVWQVLLDTDSDDTDIEWALQLDQASDNRLEFGSVTHDSSDDTWDNLTIDDSTWDSSSNFRTVATNEKKFDKAADYFIDMAIPYQVFAAQTGLGIGDTFTVGLSTSSSDTTVNTDTPDGLGPDEGPFSDTITFDPAAIPEPSSLLLTGAGLAALFLVRRRQRRIRDLRCRTATARSRPPPSSTA